MTREGRTPTMPDVMKHVVTAMLSDVHTAMPGFVTSYDAAQRRATVQPFRKRKTENGVERLPAIVNVPVVFPGGGGGTLTFPIGSGDVVLLIFAERSIDKWLSTGKEVDPGDVRKFDISDVVAIPGLSDFASVTAASASDVVLSFGGSSVTIKEGGNIEIVPSGQALIGGGATEKLMNESAMTKLNTYSVPGTGHTHSAAGVGPPNAHGSFPMVAGSETTTKTKAS